MRLIDVLGPGSVVVVRDRHAPARPLLAPGLVAELDGESGTHHEPQRLERIVNVVTSLCAPLGLR